MFRKVLDGVLWGLGFWLVGGSLMVLFAAFDRHQSAVNASAAAQQQQRIVDQQFARSESLLDRQEKSMANAERQTARLDKLMDKWEGRK